ncbi:MAG: hypothetical protein LDLANPLL_01926 [Turneriella sp.]|nr:hypothetical protein [Turneriella sp.]
MRPLLSRIFITILFIFSRCSDTAVTEFLDAADASLNRFVKVSVATVGLLGVGLKVKLQGEILSINTNGATEFSTRIKRGKRYAVSILQHPTTPGQYCVLGNASGTAGSIGIVVTAHCTHGSSNGPLVGGSIINTLSLSGSVDTTYGEIFAGLVGASAATDGFGAAARFLAPTQMSTDGTYIYLLESNPVGTLRRINISTREVTTLVNSSGSDGLTFDGEYLYTTNFNDCTIRKIRLSDNSVMLLAGAAFTCNYAEAPVGPGSTARFNNPIGITYDGTWLYVADYSNHRIRRVDPVSGATSTIAGTGVATSTDGPVPSATFNIPHGLTYYNGKLYVVEGSNQAVRVIDIVASPYNVTTLAGTGSWGCVEGLGSTAQFKKLRNIVIDGKFLYATDKECYSVWKIDLNTGYTAALSGWDSRTTTQIGTGGAAGNAGFAEPIGITSDGKNLFISDSTDFVIRRIE